MKKILYAEDHPDIREIYSIVIKNLTGREVVEFENGTLAIEEIKKNFYDYALVVADKNMYNGSGISIFNYIQKYNLDIPFVLISGDNVEDIDIAKEIIEANENNKILTKPLKKQDFEESLEFLKHTDDVEKIIIPEYIPMKLSILYRAKQTPTDIYVKLSKTKYVLIYKHLEELTLNDITKFEKRNVKFIYVENTDLDIFIDTYIEVVADIINLDQKGITAESISIQYEVHEIIHKQISNLGITQSAMDLSKKSIFSSITQMENQSNLKNIIKNIANKNEFIYEHSLMLQFLSFLVLKELDWTSHDTYYKVSMAALFHDISIKDEKLLKDIEIEHNNMASGFSEKYPEFINHPLQSSEFIHSFREIPPDIHSIIMGHHESPDGTGYPNKLRATKTFPLGAMFNTNHYFLIELYKTDFTQASRVKALNKMEAVYNYSHYEKPFQALKKVFNIY